MGLSNGLVRVGEEAIAKRDDAALDRTSPKTSSSALAEMRLVPVNRAFEGTDGGIGSRDAPFDVGEHSRGHRGGTYGKSMNGWPVTKQRLKLASAFYFFRVARS